MFGLCMFGIHKKVRSKNGYGVNEREVDKKMPGPLVQGDPGAN